MDSEPAQAGGLIPTLCLPAVAAGKHGRDVIAVALANIGSTAMPTDLDRAAQPDRTAGPTVTKALPFARATAGLLLGLTQGFGLYLVSNNLGDIQGSLGATSAEASWLT